MPNAKITVTKDVFKPPQDLPGQAQALIAETSTWVEANWLRIAIAVGIGVVIVLALLTVKKLGERLGHEDKALIDGRAILARVAHKTSFWFLVIVAAKLVDGYADTPPLLDKTIGFFFTVALTFQAAVWVRELVLGFVRYRAGLTDQDHSALGSALGIIRFLVSFTVFSIALVLVLGNLGVNVTGLVAGLGVGGIAIGLAAQGIFKDLFAALAIIFDKPFRKGDSVKWNNISGTVESIGLKTTRIRALTGEQVVVGNAHLIDKELFNLARLDHRRMILTIAIAYDTADADARRMVAMLSEIVADVDKCKLVRAGFMGIDSAGLQYELQFDVMSSNYNEVIAARSEVNLQILSRLRAAGIAFAAPDGKPQPAPELQPATPEPPEAPVPAHAQSDGETAP